MSPEAHMSPEAPVSNTARPWYWAIVICLSLAAGCGWDGGTGEGGDEPPPPGSIAVLFIGNSYTSANNLPAMIAGMAASVSIPIAHYQSTPGGARFADHKDNATTIAKIQFCAWDYVVLQNQSQVPGWRPADVTAQSLPNAQALVDLILANNPSTEVIYFQTWGRENGDTQNAAYYPLVATFDGHTQALREGYAIYAAGTGGSIAAVGDVWQDVVNDAAIPFAAGNLWSGDGSHPSLAGSYVAGLTILSTITGLSPEGVTTDSGLSAADALYIRQRAAQFLGF